MLSAALPTIWTEYSIPQQLVSSQRSKNPRRTLFELFISRDEEREREGERRNREMEMRGKQDVKMLYLNSLQYTFRITVWRHRIPTNSSFHFVTFRVTDDWAWPSPIHSNHFQPCFPLDMLRTGHPFSARIQMVGIVEPTVEWFVILCCVV